MEKQNYEALLNPINTEGCQSNILSVIQFKSVVSSKSSNWVPNNMIFGV